MPGANCSLYGCGTSRKHKDIGIFKLPLPKDDFHKKWRQDLINIILRYRVLDENLERQLSEDRIHICQRHFTYDQLYVYPTRKLLKEGALPTLNLAPPSQIQTSVSSTTNRTTISRRRKISTSPKSTLTTVSPHNQANDDLVHPRGASTDEKNEQERNCTIATNGSGGDGVLIVKDTVNRLSPVYEKYDSLRCGSPPDVLSSRTGSSSPLVIKTSPLGHITSPLRIVTPPSLIRTSPSRVKTSPDADEPEGFQNYHPYARRRDSDDITTTATLIKTSSKTPLLYKFSLVTSKDVRWPCENQTLAYSSFQRNKVSRFRPILVSSGDQAGSSSQIFNDPTSYRLLRHGSTHSTKNHNHSPPPPPLITSNSSIHSKSKHNSTLHSKSQHNSTLHSNNCHQLLQQQQRNSHECSYRSRSVSPEPCHCEVGRMSPVYRTLNMIKRELSGTQLGDQQDFGQPKEAQPSVEDSNGRKDEESSVVKKEEEDNVFLKTEEGDEETAERRKRRKAKSKYSNMENDDLEKMLKWKNGVGHLPGSNLKFRKSDMGSLEVITPSSDDDNDLEEEVHFDPNKMKRQRRGTRSRQDTQSPFSDNNTPCSTPPPTLSSVSANKSADASEKRNRKERKKKKFAEDELLKCETCGCYGLISEFRSSGRFCSQRCVGAYASKRRAEMIQQQLESGERPPPKQVTNKKHGNAKRKKSEAKDTLPSPTANKNKRVPLKQEIYDDSTVYYKTVGYETGFCWETYLQITSTSPVPLGAFFKEYAEQESFPSNPHKFQSAMKLECVDPKHQSIICCCTVVEVQGGRLRLNFDGWSQSYDFWINANSFFLHPCGWCDRNGQKLQQPKGIEPSSFNWDTYFQKTKSTPAPECLFYDPPPVARHGFRMCMKLEAVDRKNPDLVCVASVNNSIGDQFLIHFDEWDDLYDYWCREDNPYIHSMGWCRKNNIPLVPPTDEMVGKFVWEQYLDQTDCIAAPHEIFKEPKKLSFTIGDKLEVIDPRNCTLCRVATVSQAEDFKIQVHFDGWHSMYDYWFDFDSTDIHPVGWCEKTGHLLEPPPTNHETQSQCGTPGCRGVGHIKGAKYTSHHTSFGCPYAVSNINRSTSPVVDRLAVDSNETETPNGKTKQDINQTEEVFPDSTTSMLKTYSGRPKKRIGRGGVRKRKRRGSDEVSSSTNFINEERKQHVYSPIELPKKVRPTHLPAGRHGNGYHVTNSSRAIPWGTGEVADFLKGIGYEEFIPSFKDHQIDGQALLLLSQADLVHHLRLKLGPALKIYSEISRL